MVAERDRSINATRSTAIPQREERCLSYSENEYNTTIEGFVDLLKLCSPYESRLYTLHTLKRTLVSLAFLLLVVPGSGICTDGNRAYAIYGFGSYSCGKYVEEKTHGGSGHYKTWFTGYVTVINNLDPGTYDILGNTDIDGVMLWLENYCRNNHLKPFATASKALVYELYPKKTTQAPK